MTRVLYVALALIGGLAFSLWIGAPEQGSATEPVPLEPVAAADTAPAPAGATLADLAAGRLKLVDLAWPLNAKSAYWPGENYRPFELHTIATLEKDGVLSKAFASPEHLGTHLDAPNHFEPDRPSVDQIPPEHLFAPGVVIDVRGPVSADADYLVSIDDVHRFEREHGRIPTGAVVLANSGWSKYWKNPTRYQNRDVRDRLHFPGFAPEAVQFLIDQRQVRGVGLDTLSVDRGISRDFPVHHLLGKAECYGLENLAQLDELPAAGFWLFVAPIKIETGSGGPARVFAAWPPSDAKGDGGS